MDIEALFTHHYRDVYRYALGLTRSQDEAEEIASETFERAIRGLTSSSQAADRALPWLLLTARRIATDRWRRARRLARLLRAVPREPTAGASEATTDFWLWFDAVARVLSERQREVLLLRYQRDLTDRDIASIMGISESAVRSIVARSCSLLRANPELLDD